MPLAFAAGCDLLADLAHKLRRNRHNVPVGKIQRGVEVRRAVHAARQLRLAEAEIVAPRLRNSLRLALVYRPHERFVAERREMHGHRRSEAPRAEDSYIHIASSVHLHSPRARAASGLFHYSTAGDESRRRVRARIGCKKPERRNTAPAPMLRSPARFEERLAVCTLNAT